VRDDACSSALGMVPSGCLTCANIPLLGHLDVVCPNLVVCRTDVQARGQAICWIGSRDLDVAPYTQRQEDSGKSARLWSTPWCVNE
jgi:hypothetical protein